MVRRANDSHLSKLALCCEMRPHRRCVSTCAERKPETRRASRPSERAGSCRFCEPVSCPNRRRHLQQTRLRASAASSSTWRLRRSRRRRPRARFRDVAAFVACQEHRGVGDLLGVSDSAGWDCRYEAVDQLGCSFALAVCMSVSIWPGWSELTRTPTRRAPLRRPSSSRALPTCWPRTRQVGRAHQPGDGREVDDRPAAALGHSRAIDRIPRKTPTWLTSCTWRNSSMSSLQALPRGRHRRC